MRAGLPPRCDVLLDTNVAVLACSGGVPFKNTSAFDRADFELLTELVAGHRLFVLPYIVAETSNLLAQGGGGEDRLRLLALHVLAAEEGHVGCHDAVAHPRFTPLGATDAAVLVWLERNPSLWLLTTDFKLAGTARRLGLNAANFDSFRDTARP